ncbi:TetR/AcrR family transcriptional regulator [Nocardioides mangrovicus]|uniref:TetR/AcrR family transcriptional regulator n=1 Tax=Nocardioides mangrovicus TaxID=2478913 RepID=A0A3L8P3J1_9ACTN|nr:TetR/AcrR family transcriptional regulator [Nocardioides mangrovicus]RLV49661.1 TetR/AcrR family transcriptional regulator [Nocardioides mangrovicus]
MPSSPTRAEQRAASARRILDAARAEFAAHGYESTTIRAVAARAGVDPALVMQHHGSKAALFRSAARLDAVTSEEVGSHLDDVVASRVAGLPPELHALVRSMLTVPEATDAMREYLDDRVANLARSTPGPDAELRAALTVCAILGLTLGRHFLRLGALEQGSAEDVSRVARAWLAARSEDAEPPEDRPED